MQQQRDSREELQASSTVKTTKTLFVKNRYQLTKLTTVSQVPGKHNFEL